MPIITMVKFIMAKPTMAQLVMVKLIKLNMTRKMMEYLIMN